MIVCCCLMLPQPSYSLECFSQPPSVEEGRNMYAPVKTRKLTEDEEQAVISLFKGLEGKWKGDGYLMTCTGSVDNPDIETEHLSIELKCKVNREGRLLMTGIIESFQKHTKHQKILRLYLKNNILSTSGFNPESDVEIMTASRNELTYVKKIIRTTNIQKKKYDETELYPGITFYKKKEEEKESQTESIKARIVFETITSLKKTGAGSVTLEWIFYFRGMLKSKEAWHIRKTE